MPTSLQQQAEWVRLFRKGGGKHHFEKLYIATRRAVFARCLKLLRDQTQAEDATHETYLRAFERFGAFEGENFLGWVSSIATNLCLNRLRSQRVRVRLKPQLEQNPELPERPDQELMRKRQATRAEGVLRSLGKDQRKVLLLKYVEGYTYSEISEATGFDSDQIRSLLQNGKRNFRLRWEQAREERNT